MSQVLTRPLDRHEQVQREIAVMERASKRILASKEAAIKFLASTGMHDKNGRVKKKFR